jgi:D-alanyl-D-alanine carboxypeptidase (penicillin-binding protein 5/6)
MKQKIFFLTIISIIAVFIFSVCNVSFAATQTPVVSSIPMGQYIIADNIPDSTKEKSNVLTSSLKAKSAILIDENTGDIIFQYNPEEQLPIASITKIMTLNLVFDAIDSGKISLDSMVTVSAAAEATEGSQVWLKKGEQFTVNQLLQSVAIISANDSCVALAEFIEGSQEAFVVKMNAMAQVFGMNNTLFTDCTGLDDIGAHSTAYDVSIMAGDLMKNHPKAREFTSMLEQTFRPGVQGEIKMLTTNTMMNTYSGMYGIKTGTTTKAGNCLVGGAEKNYMNLISVVLGCPTTTDRFSDTKRILDYGFLNFTSVKLADPSQPVGNLSVRNSIGGDNPYKYAIDRSLVSPKETVGSITQENSFTDSLNAPLPISTKIGEATFKDKNGNIITKVDLVTANDIPKASWFDIVWALVESWVSF